MTYGVLNLAIFVPTVTMLVIAFTGMRDVVLLPAAFSVSSMLIMYLLETNNLEEPRYRLESIYFMNSDIVAVIYDARYNFLEANTKAQDEFPELVEKYRNVTIKSWVDNNNVNCEKEYRGRYYRISVSADPGWCDHGIYTHVCGHNRGKEKGQPDGIPQGGS